MQPTGQSKIILASMSEAREVERPSRCGEEDCPKSNSSSTRRLSDVARARRHKPPRVSVATPVPLASRRIGTPTPPTNTRTTRHNCPHPRPGVVADNAPRGNELVAAGASDGPQATAQFLAPHADDHEFPSSRHRTTPLPVKCPRRLAGIVALLGRTSCGSECRRTREDDVSFRGHRTHPAHAVADQYPVGRRLRRVVRPGRRRVARLPRAVQARRIQPDDRGRQRAQRRAGPAEAWAPSTAGRALHDDGCNVRTSCFPIHRSPGCPRAC